MLKLRAVGTVLAQDAGPTGTFYAFKTLPMKVLKVLKPAHTKIFCDSEELDFSACARLAQTEKFRISVSVRTMVVLRMDTGCFGKLGSPQRSQLVFF